jgi:hypothetical protein
MGFSYNVNVLNQKGSPALYTDTFANRPAFGYAGRLFIANDTSAIYEDTGTAWVLIANVSSGAGTLQQVTTNGNTSNVGISVTAGGISTNSLTDTALTLGSVLFSGAAGLVSQDNAAFFWDDTNNRLGLNTTTPGNTLDVHFAGTGASIGINNTAGNPATIVFANTGTNKWRIGNSASNTFDVYNNALATNALSIDSSNQTNLGNYNLLASGFLLKNSGGSPIQVVGYTAFRAQSSNFGFFIDNSNTGVSAEFVLNSGTSRQYTFPNATGTIALTSNLSAYLPLTGGTLTGTLNGTSGLFSSNVNVNGLATSANYKLGVTGAAFIGGTNNKGVFITDGASYASMVGLNSAISAYNSLELRGSSTDGQLFLHSSGRVSINSITDDTVNQLQVNGSAQLTGQVKVTSASTSGFITNSTNGASFHGFVIQNNDIAVAGMETNGNTGEIKIGGYQTTNDFFPVIYSDGIASMTFGVGASPTVTIAN